MSNLRPLADRIIIKPNKPEEKSPGGIIIAPTAQAKPTEGLVIAVGPGRVLENGTRRKPDVEIGSTVLYNQYAGTEVEIDGVKHRVMNEDDILAVFGPKSDPKTK